ncbi:ABC transporter permease [Roseomonas sp. OT10]|uniref:ABC transporter permease n=1 Tax=Roseomonas cutis TaxID=2897332 RepID=UPI001E44C710|nr:ABC transporter permease [Roseomonas sp. OT10]UFN49444.1 ABC transporter permease [Roseomonas sp. OT10]
MGAAQQLAGTPAGTGATRRPGATQGSRRLAGSARVALAFLALLLVWEAAVRLLAIPEYILPAPSRVLIDASGRWRSLLEAAAFTVQPMLLGYAVAVVAGVAIALSIAFSDAARQVAYPLLVFLQIVPKIAVAPLFIIWFGFGLMPKVLLVFLLSFFPVVVSALQAFRSLEPEVAELLRSSGASRWRAFRMVQLPAALPTLFAGLKVAAALAATAAVVAEFVASDRGLGYLLLEYNGNLDTPMAFAAIAVLTALGLALYGAVELAERAAIPWHVSRRRAEGEVPGL